MHNKIAYKKACILYLSYVVHCIALSSYSYHTKTPTPNHHKQQLTRKRTSKTYCYTCCCCWGCVFVKKDNNECTACTLVMYYVMVVGRECVLENKNQEEKFLLVFLLLH